MFYYFCKILSNKDVTYVTATIKKKRDLKCCNFFVGQHFAKIVLNYLENIPFF